MSLIVAASAAAGAAAGCSGGGERGRAETPAAPLRRPAPAQEDRALRRKLELLVWEHGYTVDEAAAALGWERGRVLEALSRLGIDPHRPAPQALESFRDGRVKVYPYPGGRHPRIGFLEGAIDPWKETKVSIFLPWRGAGYAVLDFPEALWTHLGLTFLAHKHIPTIWEGKDVKIERPGWQTIGGGVLAAHWRLPNGIEFAQRVTPLADGADLEFRVRNGTSEPLRNVRAQICCLLKGAPDFNAQTEENKIAVGPAAAARSRDGRRWVALAFERGRAWNNPRCPCIHSDPVLGTIAPGEETVARGRLFFGEGGDVRAELERRLRQAGLLGEPPATEPRGAAETR